MQPSPEPEDAVISPQRRSLNSLLRSKKYLVIFLVVFGLLGTYIIIHSFAASSSVITGTMFDDSNRNGSYDAGEPVWANKQFYLFDNTGTNVGVAYTDAQGKYTFANLGDGNYTVAPSSPTWWDLYSNYTPTVPQTIYMPVASVALSGTATADFGFRKIVTSSDIAAPISHKQYANGLTVNIYNDVVTPDFIYNQISKTEQMGAEAASTTIAIGFEAAGGMTSASAASSNGGPYKDYLATSYVPWINIASENPTSRTLFHEYGHAWTLYYAYIAQQDPDFTGYLKVRGLYGDSRLNTSYAWSVREMAAEDYRQLFGPPEVATGGQANTQIPLAKDVPGLKEYLAGSFKQPVATSTSSPPPTSTADTIAPSIPQNLAATSILTANGPLTTLTWSASSDNVGVDHYEVYRNGQEIGSTDNLTTTFVDTGLDFNTTYSYSVRAMDAANNQSNLSTAATVVTPGPDSIPPSAPTGLSSPAQAASSISLKWTASTDNLGVKDYKVYSVNRRGAAILVGTTTSPAYTVTGLSRKTTYSFFIIASDAAGNTSPASTRLQVTTTR